LKALRAAGYFLDLWHWRANRSNPVNLADDQLVAEARLSDPGKGAYATNWDGEKKLPRLMFDTAKAGHAALKWDDVVAARVSQDSAYALREDIAAPFDPNAAWKEGDTLPRRIVRPADNSRADIKVAGKGRWADGFWDVTLSRKMDTGNKLEDKILADRGVYHVAFAVHRQATGGRWHFVSLPYTVGLGRAADITAVRFDGDAPKWDQPATTITLFYPGQVSWAHVNSAKHPGADKVRAGVPVKFRHSEAELAHYGVEMEFNELIRRQWLLTVGWQRQSSKGRRGRRRGRGSSREGGSRRRLLVSPFGRRPVNPASNPSPRLSPKPKRPVTCSSWRSTPNDTRGNRRNIRPYS
jgi:hypothetical protein